MDIDSFYEKIQELIKNGKTPPLIESSEGAWFVVNGVKKLNFCSSHYLGLSTSPKLIKAVKNAVEKYGIGTGYRTLAGTHALHVELEERVAKFKKSEASVVLTGGYMANCAAIQTLIGKEDIIISDELNHASIIDAIRLSQVKNKFIYKHCDVDDLEEKIKESTNFAKQPKSDGEKPRILVVTDGVFSMDGDLAPLPEIVELRDKYGFLLMVDDAHGEGVLGTGGRGIVDHFGLHGKVDIEIGTFSKAFSTMGGFISGKKELIAYFKQNARQFMFSSALTIADTAALIEGVKILDSSDALVNKLWENTRYIKKRLTEIGFDTGDSKSPITPVMLGDEDMAVEFSQELMTANVFASAIKFPMVPKGTARIRIIPSASHSREDLDFGISAFEKIGKELKVI